MDTPLDNPDMETFTDGSSFAWDGKRKAGYAMVTAEQVLEAKSFPFWITTKWEVSWRGLEIDFTHMPKANGHSCLQVWVDTFTGWIEAFLCRSEQAKEVNKDSPHQWKASRGGHLHFKERTFSKSVNTFENNHI